MVSRVAEKTAAELWAELEALPEHLKGEIAIPLNRLWVD